MFSFHYQLKQGPAYVTVRSHSAPPRALHMFVYVTVPSGLPVTSLVHIQSMACSERRGARVSQALDPFHGFSLPCSGTLLASGPAR
jgi:hypothetical protein